MPATPQFRCGPLRACEWDGFWKANVETPLLEDAEADEGRESLNRWLSKRYLVEYQIEWQRHCCIEKTDPYSERTLKIIIEVAEVLSVGFLMFIQQWLREEAPLWRVSVPVDNTDENLILIYADAIRINEAAEADLQRFIETVRPRLAAVIEEGFREFGLRRKPVPPLPDN